MTDAFFRFMVYNVRMYIETVILNNFVLTFIAARLSSTLLCKRASLSRVLIASVLGTVAAVFYPFIYLPTVALVGIKTAVCVGMCLILFIKTYRAIASSLVFIGITFAIGGACFAVGFFVYGNTVAAQSLFDIIPLYIVLIIGVSVYAIAKAVFLAVRKRVYGIAFSRKCRLRIFGSDITLSAFYDSGNSTYDAKSGLPIVLAPIKTFLRKIPSRASVEFMRCLTVSRKTQVKTAGGTTNVYLMKPNEFVLYSDGGKHKILEVMLGLFSGDEMTDYDLILNNCVR